MNPPICAPAPRLASRGNRPRARRRSLISLTPLIDVVFILLIFFMLASSFLDWRSIELNAPAEATAGSSMEGALLVEVQPGGLRLSGQAVSLDGLASRLEERVVQKPDQRVLAQPDAGVALQRAIQVLDRVSAAGVAELSLIRGPNR